MRKFLFILLALLIALSSIDAQAQKRKRTTKKRTTTTKVRPASAKPTEKSVEQPAEKQTKKPAENKPSITKELKTEDDGYQWYLVKKDGLSGAQDLSGKTIVPIGFDKISCFSKDWVESNYWRRFFLAVKDNHYALYYPDGTCPINAGRQYEWITVMIKAKRAYIHVEKNGKIGICDMDGNEVVKPNYKSAYLFTATDKNINDVDYYYIRLENEDGTTDIADLEGNIVYRNAYGGVKEKNNGYYTHKEDGKDERKITINQNPSYNFNHIDGVTRFYGTIKRARNNSYSGGTGGNTGGGNTGGTQTIIVKHEREKQLVQVWKSCTYCMGSGICSYCNGWGVKSYGNNVYNCPSCPGNGRCIFCNGAKGRYETELR